MFSCVHVSGQVYHVSSHDIAAGFYILKVTKINTKYFFFVIQILHILMTKLKSPGSKSFSILGMQPVKLIC